MAANLPQNDQRPPSPPSPPARNPPKTPDSAATLTKERERLTDALHSFPSPSFFQFCPPHTLHPFRLGGAAGPAGLRSLLLCSCFLLGRPQNLNWPKEGIDRGENEKGKGDLKSQARKTKDQNKTRKTPVRPISLNVRLFDSRLQLSTFRKRVSVREVNFVLCLLCLLSWLSHLSG